MAPQPGRMEEGQLYLTTRPRGRRQEQAKQQALPDGPQKGSAGRPQAMRRSGSR
jgi:hypothetical protein